VFCVSDHTGVTVEALARSILSRFDNVDWVYLVRSFVDTDAKANSVAEEIVRIGGRLDDRPIVFTTLINKTLERHVDTADALVLNTFSAFLPALSEELGAMPGRDIGSYHGMSDTKGYQRRLDAVDFTLSTDDGINIHHYDRADVVVVGVSRCGKTPTCLYLAMHYGVRAANYPLTEEDLVSPRLPDALANHIGRLYALTIDPVRLHQIRQQRRPDSPYASLDRCASDVERAERLFRGVGLTPTDTTATSVEEISARIVKSMKLGERPKV
jgi:[pyruvate, water dikinase]-phosphate phosphotransferase / [pyruvate, water dikinase] kinase